MSGILTHIGNTPLVRLEHIGRELPVPVLVKCEHMNPGGSIKDRIALAIVDDADGAFVSGAGTGGTITGVGRRLKQRSSRVKIELADPVGSGLADWVETGELGPDGAYEVEGIGASKVPGNLDRAVIDSAERVSDEESFAMVERLVREEGLFVGGSAGTNLVAALRVGGCGAGASHERDTSHRSRNVRKLDRRVQAASRW